MRADWNDAMLLQMLLQRMPYTALHENYGVQIKHPVNSRATQKSP